MTGRFWRKIVLFISLLTLFAISTGVSFATDIPTFSWEGTMGSIGKNVTCTISPDKTSVSAGEEVTFTVKLTGYTKANFRFTTVLAVPIYDKDLFDMKKDGNNEVCVNNGTIDKPPFVVANPIVHDYSYDEKIKSYYCVAAWDEEQTCGDEWFKFTLKAGNGIKGISETTIKVYIKVLNNYDVTKYSSKTSTNQENYVLYQGSAEVKISGKSATPTPKPTATPTPKPTATPTPKPTATPTPKPTATPTPKPTATPTPTPTATPTPKPTATPTPTPTVAPTATTEVTATPEVTETPEVTATPEVTTTPEVTATPEVTSTPEVTATPEVTLTPEVTETPEVTGTPVATEGNGEDIKLTPNPDATSSGQDSLLIEDLFGCEGTLRSGIIMILVLSFAIVIIRRKREEN